MAALSVLLASCTGSGGGQKEFCDRLPETGSVLSILSDFGTTAPDQLTGQFEKGLAEYRDLERSAPRSIRADVAKVADTVELILDIVKRNPDDLSAIRKELAGKAAQLASAAKSGQAVATYARDECGIDLDTGTGVGSVPVVTSDPGSSTTVG